MNLYMIQQKKNRLMDFGRRLLQLLVVDLLQNNARSGKFYYNKLHVLWIYILTFY